MRIGHRLAQVRHFIFVTLGWRFLLALLSAIALWSVVTNGTQFGYANSPTATTLYRTVAIVPELQGTPPSGYGISSVSVTPPTITVQGLPGALANLSYVSTQPIDVSTATQETTRLAALDLPPGISTAQSINVVVTIFVTRLLGHVRVDVPVRVTHVASGLQIAGVSPPTVTLTISGPLGNLNNFQLEVDADASNLGPGSHQLPVSVNLDSKLAAQVNPATVTVILTSTSATSTH
jgi:YbbR domain-containing protein